MANKNQEVKDKPSITIDGEKHIIENMTSEQQLIINHITDLEKKARSLQFNLEQLQVGKEAFITKLKESVKTNKQE